MALLELKNVTIKFGGLKALQKVSVTIEKGNIVAIIGPNGAGKSTMFNCINGLYRGYDGTISFEGKDISDLPTHKISTLGIARTYQNIELFSNMTVTENIMVGYHFLIKTTFLTEAFRFGKFKKQETHFYKSALDIMELLGITKYKDYVAKELPYGTLKRVEIGRALAMEPTLLLLDEPASGMNEQETEEITDLILNLNQNRNITMLLVEHDMSVVMGISDLIYVLDYGKIISNGPPEKVKNDPKVIEAFLGGE